MIYGLIGCPAMGIAGAAYATVIGQIVSLVLALVFQITKNKEIKMGLTFLKPHVRTIRGIYQIGFSAIVMQALMSFMTYGVNIIFGTISQQIVTAYGIFYKIQQFVFFAGFGLRDAITPLTAYRRPFERSDCTVHPLGAHRYHHRDDLRDVYSPNFCPLPRANLWSDSGD